MDTNSRETSTSATGGRDDWTLDTLSLTHSPRFLRHPLTVYILLASPVYTAHNHELILEVVNQTSKDPFLQVPCESKEKQKTHWRNARTYLTPVNKEHTPEQLFTPLQHNSWLQSGSGETIQLLYVTERALTLKVKAPQRVTFVQTPPASCVAMTFILTDMYTYTVNKHIRGKTSVPCPCHIDNSV